MREAMGNVSSGPVTANIKVTVPELNHGPIKTCENLKKFLDCSRDKDVQIFLVRLHSSLKFRRNHVRISVINSINYTLL